MHFTIEVFVAGCSVVYGLRTPFDSSLHANKLHHVYAGYPQRPHSHTLAHMCISSGFCAPIFVPVGHGQCQHLAQVKKAMENWTEPAPKETTKKRKTKDQKEEEKKEVVA